MTMDLFLKVVMAAAAACGAVWASLQANAWVDARRRRLHAVIEYGRYHKTPNILRTAQIGYQVQMSAEIRAKLRKPDGTDHDVIANGPGTRESDLITRFNGYYRIRIENTGKTTIKGTRFLNLPDFSEAWTIKTSDRTYVTRARPIEIETLLPKDPVEILFFSYDEISEKVLGRVEIVHEGGTAAIYVNIPKPVPAYRLSSSWNAMMNGIRLGASATGGFFAVYLLFLLVSWAVSKITP